MTIGGRGPLLLVAFAFSALLVAACGGSTTPTTTPTATVAAPKASPTASPVTGKITVFAASSLTEPFKAIGAAFQQANPGATVEFSFGASSALEGQIAQGAPAEIRADALVRAVYLGAEEPA